MSEYKAQQTPLFYTEQDREIEPSAAMRFQVVRVSDSRVMGLHESLEEAESAANTYNRIAELATAQLRQQLAEAQETIETLKATAKMYHESLGLNQEAIRKIKARAERPSEDPFDAPADILAIIEALYKPFEDAKAKALQLSNPAPEREDTPIWQYKNDAFLFARGNSYELIIAGDASVGQDDDMHMLGSLNEAKAILLDSGFGERDLADFPQEKSEHHCANCGKPMSAAEVMEVHWLSGQFCGESCVDAWEFGPDAPAPTQFTAGDKVKFTEGDFAKDLIRVTEALEDKGYGVAYFLFNETLNRPMWKSAYHDELKPYTEAPKPLKEGDKVRVKAMPYPNADHEEYAIIHSIEGNRYKLSDSKGNLIGNRLWEEGDFNPYVEAPAEVTLTETEIDWFAKHYVDHDEFRLMPEEGYVDWLDNKAVRFFTRTDGMMLYELREAYNTPANHAEIAKRRDELKLGELS
jgi:hypothetical protein